jgi:FkbM family methyltransferase
MWQDPMQEHITTTPAAVALAKLFAEPSDAVVKRRQQAFDQLANGAGKPVVLYGAGGLGRIVLQGLRSLGRPPVAFADRRVTTTSGSVDGIPTFSPNAAVERLGNDAVFVVSIWNAQTDHQYVRTREDLMHLGARYVAPALALFWKHAETFLPYYCLDVPERVLAAQDDIRLLYEELADDASRDVLVRQLRWRLDLDFGALPRPVEGPAYFQSDLLPIRQDEVFVDCGAYDGDSLRAFRSRMEGNVARVIAIEPDPASHARLEASVSTFPPNVRRRMRTLKVAVGRYREKLRFESSGLASARASDLGTIEVDCLPLDEILEGDTPTLVKMDLEGAEVAALLGGEAAIRRAKPSMAVCVYHRPDHLWTIPLLLRRMLPRHALYLRPHGYEGWDLVCYAIAPGRS